MKNREITAICITLGPVIILLVALMSQSQQIRELEERLASVETAIKNSDYFWETNEENLSNLFDRVAILETDNRIMVNEVCGDPCFLDPINRYVSRLDYLWAEVYGEHVTWNTMEMYEEQDMWSRIDQNEMNREQDRAWDMWIENWMQEIVVQTCFVHEDNLTYCEQ